MSFPARGNRRRGAIGGSKLAREAVSPRGRGGAAGEARGEWGRGRGGDRRGSWRRLRGRGVIGPRRTRARARASSSVVIVVVVVKPPQEGNGWDVTAEGKVGGRNSGGRST